MPLATILEFLTEINKLLQNDGYELYPAEKVSNRDVYRWRIFQREESALFVPYSQRNSFNPASSTTPNEF